MSEINYETRITQVVVVPEGEATSGYLATTIEIQEAGDSECLIVKQSLDLVEANGGIRIYPQEWPMLRAAIEDMMARCRRDV
jgi:hypothetical protein